MTRYSKTQFNWLFSALLFSSSTTYAIDFKECGNIKADSSRLACYDALVHQKQILRTEHETIASKENITTSSHDKPSSQRGSEPGVLTQRIHDERAAQNNPFLIKAYKPNYILVATYTPSNLDNSAYGFNPQHAEAKYQLSFQFNWWDQPFGKNTAFYFGYTQLSFWQMYNSNLFGSSASAPFRETDYEPEIGLDLTTNTHFAGLDFRKVRASFIHQSNGQGGLRSRSWNRLALQTGFERGNFAGAIRGWYRIPESRATDDNPDITDYLGYGDLTLAYKFGTGTLSTTIRNNLKSNNRGSIELDYSFPFNKHIQGYVQYYTGYGESLIDYNRSINRIGIGFALTNWL